LKGTPPTADRDQPKRQAQERAKSQAPSAKSQEPRAKSQEPRAKSQEPRAKSIRILTGLVTTKRLRDDMSAPAQHFLLQQAGRQRPKEKGNRRSSARTQRGGRSRPFVDPLATPTWISPSFANAIAFWLKRQAPSQGRERAHRQPAAGLSRSQVSHTDRRKHEKTATRDVVRPSDATMRRAGDHRRAEIAAGLAPSTRLPGACKQPRS
jgi:hypothetical protein